MLSVAPFPKPSFDALSPDCIIAAVEGAVGRGASGSLTVYPSYVNRVYGLRLDDGDEVIAKFYRPGRWEREAILEEHRFLEDCAEAELPVVPPLAMPDGCSLGELVVEDESGGAEVSFQFSLFPKMGGRNFDAEAQEDWLRLGALLGRLHAVGVRREATKRLRCRPEELTAPLARLLVGEGLLPKDLAPEFLSLCEGTLSSIAPCFDGITELRIHGDCHRGNILDRPGEGLLVIDFDDMMMGPAVQDLWLLLPDHADACRRELGLLVEGYETFHPFDRRELALVESLRFMRLIYFLAWRARQREDFRFRDSFPEWWTEGFWATELQELRDQAERAIGGLRRR
ncbi:MAG: serine/threonine protein kinase [Spirochaetaceae bacterium]|nr:serine/threonine protein kinase [Spirochaetaceae bacterium]